MDYYAPPNNVDKEKEKPSMLTGVMNALGSLFYSPERVGPPASTGHEAKNALEQSWSSLLNSPNQGGIDPNFRVYPKPVPGRKGTKPVVPSRPDAVAVDERPEPQGGGPRGEKGGGKHGTPPKDMGGTGTATNPTEAMEVDPLSRAMEEMIAKYEGKKKLNLAPLLALTDSWTGSNLLRGYERPETDDERERNALTMRQRLGQHEADLKYKKSYLTQMAAQRNQQMAIKQMELDNRLKIAGLTSAGRGAKGAATDERRLGQDNKGALEMIAVARYGDPKNPEGNKQVGKAYWQTVHQEALAGGKALEDQGLVPKGQGYHEYVSGLLNQPLGPDGAGMHEAED